ncbi:MAG: hypothetical protein ACRDMH_05205 [Solirubrobacterales bacterium]
MGRGQPCNRDGCDNPVSEWARRDKIYCDDRACILTRAKARKERSQGHGGQRLRTAAEKASGKRDNGFDATGSWYSGGQFRVWYGASRSQSEMRNAYLHQKALFAPCGCGLILRGDTKRELGLERRNHTRHCLLHKDPDHWSVLALAARTTAVGGA